MADKMLHEYFNPTIANVPIGPAVNMGDADLQLKTSLILIVQAHPFYGLPSEDANAHLQHFLELCDTIVMEGVTPKMIRLHLFLFSLRGRAKQWFYKDQESINTWNKCSTTFLAKFFPMDKTDALHGRISNFYKTASESILEVGKRLQEHILACPHHGMEDWLILQNFYNRLTSTSRAHIDAATRGAFFSLTVSGAMALN
ncbi:uncharacterized protein [Miscanthus floridulus]|uniref:uncharacterized protein n=1 Tax=Miscanthus floridulus TaxID=154761 RepID=UPI0034593DCA